ncbi:hypothetical protein BE20_20925 [Sorangium cellulosum]|nr:hypothetical protein BE20_20925 [Sorangium cellulosum]
MERERADALVERSDERGPPEIAPREVDVRGLDREPALGRGVREEAVEEPLRDDDVVVLLEAEIAERRRLAR